MLAKSWKKILLILVIIACLWNIISKIGKIVSYRDVIDTLKENNNQEEVTNKNN